MLCRALPGRFFRPYDLVVVRREHLNPAEHFTISAAGVVRMKAGTLSSFTTLAQWLREKTLFELCTHINFFRHYLIGRCFRRWHKVSCCPVRCSCRSALQNEHVP